MSRTKSDWMRDTYFPHIMSTRERNIRFSTVSDEPIDVLYTADDLKDIHGEKDVGLPGEFPFTRGIHPNMYRGKLWTMRMFAGFATPRETNKRFKTLLAHGQTGLSVAFDMPTLMGIDADNLRARGEVGKCGVSVSSLKDMEILFEGVLLDQVTTSMTINAPAAVLLAMYLVVAEKQGVSWDKVGGTLQNDILKEYIAQKEWLFPPLPSLQIVTDTVEFCTHRVPRWNTISISGYHIREAGSTAVQELAFTLADGICYVEDALKRGLAVDQFAPRLSFFFNAHNDFFEEIAKYRAARCMWAKIMRDRFKATDPKSLKLRFHAQTAGCTLTDKQPVNNVARVAIQALAAVLGGAQSLHTNSMDETLGLPTDAAVAVALRTQQIIAEETGVINVVDPLGGSYFLETLTNRMEQQAFEYIKKIDQLGGMISAIDAGFPQREVAKAAFHYQQQVERGEKIIVGMNKYQEGETIEIPTLVIGKESEEEQLKAVAALRQSRNSQLVEEKIKALKAEAVRGKNIMPPLIEAVKVYATIGEICEALQEVYGEYREPSEMLA